MTCELKSNMIKITKPGKFYTLYGSLLLSFISLSSFLVFGGSAMFKKNFFGRTYGKFISFFDYPILNFIPPFIYVAFFITGTVLYFDRYYRVLYLISSNKELVQYLLFSLTPTCFVFFLIVLCLNPGIIDEQENHPEYFCSQTKQHVQDYIFYSYINLRPVSKKNFAVYTLFIILNFGLFSTFLVSNFWFLKWMLGYIKEKPRFDSLFPDLLDSFFMLFNEDSLLVTYEVILLVYVLWFFVKLVDLIFYIKNAQANTIKPKND